MKLLSKLLFGVVLLSSCTPVYVPNSRNIPDVENKGEAKIASMISSNGFDLNTNLMVIDNVGVMGNFSYASQNRQDGYHDHIFGEAGIGYHLIKEKINFSIYSGYGWGKAYTEWDSGSGLFYARGNYGRVFLQPSLSINTGFFVPAFGLRFTRVQFNNYEEDSFLNQTIKTSRIFFEPAAQFAFRFNPIEASIQIGMIVPVSETYYSSLGSAFEYRALLIGGGIAYRINYDKQSDQ